MAQMRGLGFRKGNLGDINFRQQVVKVKNGYAKRTVASQKILTNSSNSAKQSKQRSKFRLVQQLATALSASGILRNFYATPNLLPGYQKFIQDHLFNDYAIVVSGGQNFLDFKKVMVTKGGKAKNIKAYAVDGADPVTGIKITDDGCHCEKKLAWDYSYMRDGDGANWVLQLVGVKIAEDGSIEEILHEQPLATMNQCSVDVKLPYCNCCKTYWYGFFVNAAEGMWTTSKYFGTCSCELSVYDDTCATCEDVARTVEYVTPPSDCADGHCNEGEGIDPASIIYNGTSQIADTGNGELMILVPSEGDGCNAEVVATTTPFQSAVATLSSDFTVESTAAGTSSLISISDPVADIENAVRTHLGMILPSSLTIEDNGDGSFKFTLNTGASIDGLSLIDVNGDEITITETSKVRIDYAVTPDTADVSIMHNGAEVETGRGTLSLIVDAGTEGDYELTVNQEGCEDAVFTYRLATDNTVTRIDNK